MLARVMQHYPLLTYVGFCNEWVASVEEIVSIWERWCKECVDE